MFHNVNVKKLQSISSEHPEQAEDTQDYWNALATAVVQNIMQLQDAMVEHDDASDPEFKQLHQSLDCTSIYKV